MKPNEKRTQNLYKTLYYSGSVEEEFENIIKECERKMAKYTDPNFYPQKSIIEEDREKLNESEWRRLERQYPINIFDNISPEGIKQGSLADCYFVVSLIYASHDINMVKSFFHPKSSLKYGVVLVYFWFLGERIPVIIDTQVAYANKNSEFPLFCHPRTNFDSCWFVLVEKAYAKACGGYSFIQSGSESFAIHLLLDYYSTFFSPIVKIIPVNSLEEAEKEIENPNEKVFSILTDLKNEKAMIGTSTNDEISSDIQEEVGLIKNHAYNVLDMRESENKKFIKLRNPWGTAKYKGPFSIGSSEWTEKFKEDLEYTEKDDGSFWMPYEDFLKYYDEINYSLKKEKDWKETSVYGKIEGYLDYRSPCANFPSVGCIPQWTIKFSQKTIVRLSYDIAGPFPASHSIYICKNHGYKVNYLNVKTEIKTITSNSSVNGIEYVIDDFSEPYTFFLNRNEANDEPSLFRILIQSPDVGYIVKKFDDNYKKWNGVTETGFFDDNESNQWDPFNKERPLSTCKQWYIYFPDLKYNEKTELRFRIYKNKTEGSFYLFFASSEKRIRYSTLENMNFEIYSKTSYEEFSIPINRKVLKNNENYEPFHYAFAFYRKEKNDVNQFKFSVLSKCKFKFGLLPGPDPINNCCYQVTGKLYHDGKDGSSPYTNGLENMKQWCLIFKEWPTKLYIEYSNKNKVSSNHYIYLQKVKDKGQKIGVFYLGSLHMNSLIQPDCLHDLVEWEIQDNSRPYSLCVSRDPADSTSEYTLNIFGTEEFDMFEINDNGLGKKLPKFTHPQQEKEKIDFPEIKYIEQPNNFTPKRYNSKLRIDSILNNKSKSSISNYIFKEIIDQWMSLNPKRKEIRNIEDYLKFDLKFQFPNGKSITIENYNRMTIFEIFKSFYDEGFYYSETVIKKKFYIVPEEDEFTGDIYERLECNIITSDIITLSHGQSKFYFLQSESASEAYNFLRAIYQGSESIIIYDSDHKKVKFASYFKADEQYTVYVEYQVMFKFIDETFSTQYFEYYTTVLEVRKKLASLFVKDDEDFKTEYIIIYNQNHDIISNDEEMLKDTQNFQKLFYFTIDFDQKKIDKLNKLKAEEKEKQSEIDNKEDISISTEEEKKQQNNSDDDSIVNISSIKKEDKAKNEPISSNEESLDSLSYLNDSKYQKYPKTPQIKSNKLKLPKKSERISKSLMQTNKKKENSFMKSPNEEGSDQKPPKQYITVIFICNDFDDVDFNPIEKTLSIDTTINEIQEIIAYEYIIPKNQITIKYRDNNTKIKIDPDKTIEDYQEKMKEMQRDGRFRNYLYFELSDSFENQYNAYHKYHNCYERIKNYKNDLYYDYKDTYSPKIVKTPNSHYKPTIRMKRRKRKTNFKPQIQPPIETKPPPVIHEPPSDKSSFVFQYGDKERELVFTNDILLNEIESLIKKIFKIEAKEEIQFFTMKNDKEEMIQKHISNMDSLKNQIIKIYLENEIQKPLVTYHYQINKNKDVLDIDLDPDSPVKQMKKVIAKQNKVKDLKKIQIYHNGKELSNDVILDFLSLSDDVLHVNMEEEELFLITETIGIPNEVTIEEEEEDI